MSDRAKRAIGYARLSKEDVDDNGDVKATSQSIVNQKDMITRYCEMKGFELVDIIDVDDGVSGTVPVNLRSGGKRLCRILKAGKVGNVIVTSQDRLFRSVSDALATVKEWEGFRVATHIVRSDVTIDTSTWIGWFMFVQIAVQDESWPRLTSEKTKTILRAKRDKGERVSAKATYGYKLVDGVQVPDEKEQTAINIMFALRDEGHTLGEISDTLGSMGYMGRTRKDGTAGQIQRSTIMRVLARGREQIRS